MQEAQEHVLEIIKNPVHFPARWLREARARIGLEEEHIAVILVAVLSMYLAVGEHAQFLANAIGVAVPLLLCYVYVDEKPSTQNLQVYWSVFGLLTVLDTGFENCIPLYYIVKLVLLALLFLKPFTYAEKLLELTKQFEQKEKKLEDAISEIEQKSKGRKSPPPEKPEEEAAKIVKENPSSRPQESPSVKDNAPAQQSSVTTAIENSKSEPAPQPETASQPTAESPSATSVPSGTTRDADGHPQQNSNYRDEMAKNASQYRLSSDENGLNFRGAAMPVAANDFITEPTNSLVFNAPFEDGVLSYYLTIKNNTPRTMAFAMKSNAIPRLTANPPCGILKPRQRVLIWINMQPFKWGEIDVSRDRIAFDYVLCPADTKKFTHKLFQGDEPRRRKNIHVLYNP
ncbi:unnamed protein product [Bursaphelenchus xylophilus]|uniref:Major sperm protein n=1 Tax=Bursaphelenchus xylophilus TaxID=6326 RepID=A0A1I7SD24_BURXY|nr:unnamed protein product [Bursaphelenchus xylophilus]CAG9093061.1 unnamed protein product [Bursaphelenchus xylophilus]